MDTNCMSWGTQQLPLGPADCSVTMRSTSNISSLCTMCNSSQTCTPPATGHHDAATALTLNDTSSLCSQLAGVRPTRHPGQLHIWQELSCS